jgi:hypothetical protein
VWLTSSWCLFNGRHRSGPKGRQRFGCYSGTAIRARARGETRVPSFAPENWRTFLQVPRATAMGQSTLDDPTMCRGHSEEGPWHASVLEIDGQVPWKYCVDSDAEVHVGLASISTEAPALTFEPSSGLCVALASACGCLWSAHSLFLLESAVMEGWWRRCKGRHVLGEAIVQGLQPFPGGGNPEGV